MDLCCLNSDCVPVMEKASRNTILDSEKKELEESESATASNKLGKGKMINETGQSMANVLNKFTSQIKKPPHRKSSPINWFPRKKVEPYLRRKLKLLQEVDGLNLTLDETLGEANPHYSRVKREQIAAREAAYKAMEARRAALVEASWCRILQAARIKSKEAEAMLGEAEKFADEAFEEATAVGVTMFDFPNCPSKIGETQTSTTNGEGPKSHHTVAALFQTAFEVDKEVASAVKASFTRLANCPSISKDDFKDLLRKISENPDMEEQHCHEFSSEGESDTGSDIKKNHFTSRDFNKCKNLKMMKLVDMMLDRLKGLKEDELKSLATIVATCGLNAALAEVEHSKQQCSFVGDFASFCTASVRDLNTESFINGKMRRKQVEPELPSLDKFLVKHMTKLEKEVLEAKNTRKNELKSTQNEEFATNIPDLATMFVKHSSKFEKEIEEAKKNSKKIFEKAHEQLDTELALPMAIPDMGSILIKHSSKLEKEIEESKLNSGKEYGMIVKKHDFSKGPSLDKLLPDLGSILIKHSSKLEKEIEESKLNSGKEYGMIVKKHDFSKGPSLDKLLPDLGSILIKHSSKLEKEIEESKLNSGKEYGMIVKKHDFSKGPSLDKLLVKKHVSRLEREVQEAKNQQKNNQIARSYDRQADKENMDSDSNTEGKSIKQQDMLPSLDELLVKRVSKFEREVQEVKKKQQQENKRAQYSDVTPFGIENGDSKLITEGKCINKTDSTSGPDILGKPIPRLQCNNLNLQKEKVDHEDGLEQILVKHKSKLEREKMAAANQQEYETKSFKVRREERERELQEAWGGLSLGNSIHPRLSKLERDKAAWIKAEDEERSQTTMKEVV